MSHAAYVHDQRPLRIYWEVTRACDLACRHCRATAVPDADPDELTHREALRLIADLGRFGDPLPHLVFTGGDPLKRTELFELIAAARQAGFRVSVAPSATPLLTHDAIVALHEAGIDAISLSLDGSTAARHDAIRGVERTFEHTLAAAAVAARIGLLFQVNTVVCGDTADDLPAISRPRPRDGRSQMEPVLPGDRRPRPRPATDVRRTRRGRASLGRGAGGGTPQWRPDRDDDRGAADATRLTAASDELGETRPHGQHATHAAGIRDGNGVMFISHTGDICPSGFLELRLGNVRHDHVVDVYREAGLFPELRRTGAILRALRRVRIPLGVRRVASEGVCRDGQSAGRGSAVSVCSASRTARCAILDTSRALTESRFPASVPARPRRRRGRRTTCGDSCGTRNSWPTARRIAGSASRPSHGTGQASERCI